MDCNQCVDGPCGLLTYLCIGEFMAINSRERRSFRYQEALYEAFYAVLVLVLVLLTTASLFVISEVLFPSMQIVK